MKKIKTIDTLIEDIYALFDPEVPHTVSEDTLEEFAENVKELLRQRLGGRTADGPTLRFSKLGTPDRKLWYEAQGTSKEKLSGKTLLKFMYGDLIEQLVIFLCKEAGHTVTDEQREVEVSGVLGHIDCVIDGVLVDVKSASPYGFKKFEKGDFIEDDPFGYVPQLSGYANVLSPQQSPAFLAFDKVSGELCLAPISTSIVGQYDPGRIIEHQKEVLEGPLPDRCYEDKEDGKSGNRKLGTECSYCHFKKECYPELRTFLYSTGPRFLTRVVREPDVYEAT